MHRNGLRAVEAILLIGVAALGLAACTGEDGAGEASPSVEVHDVDPQALVLTIDDMPTGWRESSDEDEPLPPCLDFGGHEPGPLAVAEPSRFERDSSAGTSSYAAQYRSVSDAAAAFRSFEQQDFEACYRNALEKQPGAPQIELSGGRMSFPSFGDESFAMQYQVRFSLGKTYVDFILIRHQELISLLGFASGFNPLDSSLEQDLARTVALRMEAPGG